jgi:hypothetical protein
VLSLCGAALTPVLLAMASPSTSVSTAAAAMGVATSPMPSSAGNAASSTSNPRKFSEKIALHKQKEAEEKAEFDKMMKELTAVKGMQQNARVRERKEKEEDEEEEEQEEQQVGAPTVPSAVILVPSKWYDYRRHNGVTMSQCVT